MKGIKKCILLLLAIVIASSGMFEISAQAKSAKWKKACKAYKTFLAKNESHFYEPEDFYTRNNEITSTASSFILSDMNRDGIPELVTYHIEGKKMGYLQFYTYKNKKVKKLKCKTRQGTFSNVNVSCNAAGWYNIYKDKKGYIHTDWNGGNIGYTNTTYRMKKGKVVEYLCVEEDYMVGINNYYVNMKSSSWSQYNSIESKLTAKSGSGMINNTTSNRKKKLK